MGFSPSVRYFVMHECTNVRLSVPVFDEMVRDMDIIAEESALNGKAIAGWYLVEHRIGFATVFIQEPSSGGVSGRSY